MMDQVIITETQSIEEPVTEEHNTADESVDTSISVPDVDKNHVPETMDETSTTSSATSTPPRTQFDHTKNDNSRKMNVNPNYPVLVYQYPISQQTQNTEDARFKVQQRPTGVYLMPQQQYVTGNQYMVSYPQVGTGVQPVYYPTLSWQQQHPYNNNSAPSLPRPHYEQRRPYNNNFKPAHNATEWESHNGYQSHRFNNNTSTYQRGNSYRKRGGWSSSTNPRGRGNYVQQPRRYPDSPSTLTPSTDNL
ncbi:hypothetical protein BDF21DRAFT_164077 [Thamnidium elegans]|nr:hypothetical protein BDF21DRAFT_164077 [Thamnidium elegans]